VGRRSGHAARRQARPARAAHSALQK
jgi:hypothetical protein